MKALVLSSILLAACSFPWFATSEKSALNTDTLEAHTAH
jgi:hypothetical protein